MTTPKPTGLQLLREPFPANQISKLPKESRAQIDERKANRDSAVNCQVCGSWHHRKAVHLDYVGHAALTDRLLDSDPSWTWEPLSVDANGLPVLDGYGGMWIRLTVCGVTRLGYGHAGDKSGGDAIKEVIGDALRNAAMRFGAALELWHKGDLHVPPKDEAETKAEDRKAELDELALYLIDAHENGKDTDAIRVFYDPATFPGDSGNDDKLYVWGLLKTHSKLRALLKANRPDLQPIPVAA